MKHTRKEKGSGNLLSFLLSIVFFGVIVLGMYLLYAWDVGLEDLTDVSVFEIVLLSLAVFRLQRLLVYDKVAQYIRDLFLDLKEEKEDGIVYVVRTKPTKGLRRLFSDLFDCPWCIGVWAAVFTVFLYFLFPWTWPFWLILAIAGASSFLMLSINMIGWIAERNKQKAKKHGGERQ